MKRHLDRNNCPITDLIIKMLEIVLSFNFCKVKGSAQLWHQTVGFPTGVACGAEVANIYLHELIYEDQIVQYMDNYILLFFRYIDDILIFWSGVQNDYRARVDDLCTSLNQNYVEYNFEITSEISTVSAVFLDLRLWFGSVFVASGFIDTGLHQKAISRYLYLPFYTCHPRHTLQGFIRGEFLRYLLRSTHLEDYVSALTSFYERLQARAYPCSFLNPLFAVAPKFKDRARLLFADKDTTQRSIPFVLKLTYSSLAESLNLGQALEDDRGQLPSHLRGQPRLVVWKRAPRLGDALKSNNNNNNNSTPDSTTPPQPPGDVVVST